MTWKRLDVWSPADIATTIRLWDAGKTGSEIAAALSVERTRSAVLGYVHRLRVAGQSFTRKTTPKGTRVRDKQERRRIYQRAALQPPKPPKPRKEPRVPPPPVDASNAKPWTERTFGECAFPISGQGADTFSCCTPTGGKTYCAAHASIMFAAPATRAQIEAAKRAREAKAKSLRMAA
jgi:GcrA cell cycle regulator